MLLCVIIICLLLGFFSVFCFVYEKNQVGDIVFYIVVVLNYKKVVKILLEVGVDMIIVNNVGQILLEIVCCYNNLEVVFFFIKVFQVLCFSCG